jgi:hypothetical protein
MVLGSFMAVTNDPLVSQCAEIHNIAFGTGRVFAVSLQPFTKMFSSMAFIGLPCPTNSTGMMSVLTGDEDTELISSNFIIIPVIGKCDIVVKKVLRFITCLSLSGL